VADLLTLERDRECYEATTDILSAKSQLFSDGDTGREDVQDQLLLSSDNIRCFIHIQEEGFCERINTTSAFCEANRQVRITPSSALFKKNKKKTTKITNKQKTLEICRTPICPSMRLQALWRAGVNW
jgi:hypothetical protein